MTESPGSGFTQKEMLIRIDSKLDALAGRITSVELKQALLEDRLRVSHDNDDKVDDRLTSMERKFNGTLKGIGAGLFVGALAYVRGLVGQ